MDDHTVKLDIVRKFPILEPLVKEKGYDAIVPYRLPLESPGLDTKRTGLKQVIYISGKERAK